MKALKFFKTHADYKAWKDNNYRTVELEVENIENPIEVESDEEIEEVIDEYGFAYDGESIAYINIDPSILELSSCTVSASDVLEAIDNNDYDFFKNQPFSDGYLLFNTSGLTFDYCSRWGHYNLSLDNYPTLSGYTVYYTYDDIPLPVDGDGNLMDMTFYYTKLKPCIMNLATFNNFYLFESTAKSVDRVNVTSLLDETTDNVIAIINYHNNPDIEPK